MTPASAVANEAAAEEQKAAVLAGIGCYAFWGFLPLLFKAAAWAGAGPWEMVAWRAVWSLVVITFVVGLTRCWQSVRAALRTPRTLGLLIVAAALNSSGRKPQKK